LFLRSELSEIFCYSDQINANSTFEKEYSVTPLLANNKEKRGLALDGKLKDEDTNLASSTMSLNLSLSLSLCSLQPDMDKQIQGVIVSYKIKVTLVMGGGLLGSLTLRFRSSYFFSFNSMLLDSPCSAIIYLH